MEKKTDAKRERKFTPKMQIARRRTEKAGIDFLSIKRHTFELAGTVPECVVHISCHSKNEHPPTENFGARNKRHFGEYHGLTLARMSANNKLISTNKNKENNGTRTLHWIHTQNMPHAPEVSKSEKEE